MINSKVITGILAKRWVMAEMGLERGKGPNLGGSRCLQRVIWSDMVRPVFWPDSNDILTVASEDLG